MRFGILKKFLFAFLILSLLPLTGLAVYTWITFDRAGINVMESSRKALTENSMSILETRARSIAAQVELFLSAGCDDLNLLSALPPDPDIYLQFARTQKRTIWIRTGTAQTPEEARLSIPLYREVTFTNPSGIVEIHVNGGKLNPSGNRITGTFMSDFGPEDYFSKASLLPAGKMHVSHLVGRHILREEQLGAAENVEDAVGGKGFRGIIRFAAPVYDGGELRGVVALGLDHRHLMEYTQHVLPFGNTEVVFPRYRSGNYAFMFDDEGWMITHPKFWDLRGFDGATGKLVDPVSPEYNEENLKSGKLPFNLLHVPFIHTNYKHIAKEVLSGRSGITKTSSVGGVSRVLAFAPIRFERGEFSKTGYFGGVTLGAETALFHRAIDETSERIDSILTRIVNNFALFILTAGIGVSLIAYFLAKSFTRPIIHLTHKVKEISRGKYDTNIEINTNDELAILGQDFKEMGAQLKKHEQHLVRSLKDLEKSRDEIRVYNTRLENHVDILKIIHSGSHLLTRSFDRENVYEVILKTCVDGIGFERASLYILRYDRRSLSCVKAYGFDPETEKKLFNTTFDIEADKTVETLVFKSGLPVRILDVENEPGISETYREKAGSIGTKSIAFARISVAERVIGVLCADHTTSARPISTERMEYLSIIANEAAMSIERARLMDQTLKRKNLIESIFSNLQSSVLAFDSRGKVLAANSRTRQFFCKPPSGVIGRQVEELLTPYPELLALVEENRGEEAPATLSCKLFLPDGKLVHLESTITSLKKGSVFDDRSKLLIIRDVTQRKNMEKHLSRSDRLVSLGILAAGVAHEIRNPLTGITLLLDDLHDRMANRVDERHMMQRALEEIEKLENIVNGLLEFSANPAHQLTEDDINRVVDDALFFVTKQCGKSGIHLIKKKGEGLPLLQIDPERIKQALLNIVLNAMKVLDAGGKILVRTQLCDNPDVFPGQKAVELSVADNGPGISKEDAKFIFDPFFTHNPDGTGLGLSITHTIIKENNGKIVVDSEPGKGSCFRIYLPVA